MVYILVALNFQACPFFVDGMHLEDRNFPHFWGIVLEGCCASFYTCCFNVALILSKQLGNIWVFDFQA